MDIKYKITKLKNNSTEEVNDAVSVEEPLEMNLRYNLENKWHIENITITMSCLLYTSPSPRDRG